MNWGSLGNFLSMNDSGHAPFIWGSYGMLLAVIVVETVMARRRRAAALAEARRIARAEAGRPRVRDAD